MAIIEINNISKTFVSSFGKKKVEALANLFLSVEEGTIFGLLGPNGAGKTTLIKILLGITFPTNGDAMILGSRINDFHLKERIGYLPENHRFPAYLTGGEVLNLFGRLSGLDGILLNKKADELLETVNLAAWKKTKIKNYSKGMMQRLGLAQSMINEPDIIFLDEPTDGVDPLGRKEIRDLLISLKNQGKTIFLNSHLLSEVEMISDRVGILNKGKLIKESSVQDLTESKEEYQLSVGGAYTIPYSSTQINKIDDESFTVKVSGLDELNKLIDELRKNGVLIREIKPLKTTLEDMFISIIKDSEGNKK